MKRQLVFQVIKSHAKYLGQGLSHSFFDESSKNEESVTTIHENEIVDWIFQDESRQDLIFRNLYHEKASQIFYCFRVDCEPILTNEDRKKIGDIDMLICPRNYPNYATAVEFKRVKVETLDDQTAKVNKLQTCRIKGLDQVDQLRSFNFWKTYLGVIIEDDARRSDSESSLMRSSTGDLEKAIYNLTFDKGLDHYAGVMYIQIIQPTGESFHARNSFGICIDKYAKPVIQDEELTKRIEKFMTIRGV